ncbi:hypothetical protein [Moorena sp. SIO2C4]|uniref:hypothetical protein n=1 Tax=Moorena sp. SIO2C4 TaxID=2607824 RepID=UPI0002E3ADAF|nr:hypothetical protein [Moorena sp. SIO2C4]NEQ13552.1 hypothetical protein [Moorena sp. SIO3E2]NES46703.1 hypothetical protein [Moorena sp. SIO2C4]
METLLLEKFGWHRSKHSAISRQLSVISYQLSAISYQLSAFSFQLSAFSLWATLVD